MELDDADKYASAALFTLALYQCQMEVGVDSEGKLLSSYPRLWGCPEHFDLDEFLNHPIVTAGEKQTCWGWDTCGPNGLCRRVYQHLAISERGWVGLLKIPDGIGDAFDSGSVKRLTDLVKTYSNILDPDLTFTGGRARELFRTHKKAAQAAAEFLEPFTESSDCESVSSGSPRKSGESGMEGRIDWGKASAMLEEELTPARIQDLLHGGKPVKSAGDLTLLADDIFKHQGQKIKGAGMKTPDACQVGGSSGGGTSVEAESWSLVEKSDSELGDMDVSKTDHKIAIEEPENPFKDIENEKSTSQTDGVGVDQAVKQSNTSEQAGSSSQSMSDSAKLRSGKSDRDSGSENSSVVSDDEGGLDRTAVVPAAAFNPGYMYNHHAAAKACMALQMLLEGCLSVPLADKNAKKNKSESLAEMNQQEGEVQVQWYDARCRVALKRVAHWLQIPWPTMVAFEMGLLSEGVKHLKKEGEINKSGNVAARWATVGAVAIGGGAVVALTGGLAAPAIAAGLGSAVSLFGGGAATATAVSGFAASTAGTATITSTFAAIGAGSTGKKMMKRIGGIKEFGFWDVSESWEEVEKLHMDVEEEVEKKSRFSSWFTRKEVAKDKQNDKPPINPSGSKKWSSYFTRKKKQPAEPPLLQNSDEYSDSVQPTPVAEATPPPTDPTTQTTDSKGTESNTTLHSQGPRPSERKLKSAEELSSNPRAASDQPPLLGRSSAPGRIAESDSDGATTKSDGSLGEATSSRKEEASWWGGSWSKLKEKRPLLPLPMNPRRPEGNLSLTIGVTGWLRNYEDFLTPWEKLPGLGTDRIALVWEAEILKAVGDALVKLITDQIATETAKWFIKKYLYTGLLSAVAIPLLILTLTSVTIDNKWAIAMERSSQAGKLLAQCIIERFHGDRPVTLVGFSLGAKVVFQCLLELSRQGKVGVIENVVLLGTPVGVDPARWSMVRSVVSGRLVNGYSSKDWVLGITYRASTGFIRKAAGLCAVEVPGVENVDLSEVIHGHTEYVSKMEEIMDLLNLRNFQKD
ncbi:hypothetical protein BSKO_06457 [Bryopsis sp. KO-2023]|nr:hypothetical protein BSKO_06457 [Bryopsis sp. KO-2023]